MTRPAVALIDRYLLRELVAPFVFGVVLLTFFLVIDRIYNLTELVITKGVPFHLVVALLLFTLPSFLGLTLPMALLVASLLAGGRLAGDLEVVALKSAGVSLFRLMRPMLLAGVGVTVAVGTMTIWGTPLANRQFQQELFKIFETRAAAGVKERVFNTTFGDVIIYVEDVAPSQVALHGVLVSDERDPRLTRIITASDGRILTDQANRRIVLRLMDGAVNEADVMPANAPPTKDGARPPAGGAAANTRYRYTTFNLYDMSLPLDSSLRGAARIEKPEKDLSLADLDAEIVRLAPDAHGRRPYEVEWHKRFALPLATIVFLLVGFPLAVRSHRGGRSIALFGSLVILVAYYLLLTSLEGMALRLTLPAWVAMWLPNALFAFVGIVLLVATAREWRWPTLPFAWRVVDAISRRWPRRRGARAAPAPPTGARDSTHLIDRYLVREHLMFMVVCLGIATALAFMIDLLNTLDRYLRMKPPITYIIEHFLYHVPADVHSGLPVVMLVATVFLFITLHRHHELTALKAAGVSMYRIAAPILALGFVVALGAGLFQELILPILNERGEEVDRVKIRGQLPRHLQSRQHLWLRSTDTRFYRVELLAPGTNDLYGMTLLEIDRQFRLQHRLDAQRAHWTRHGWQLSEGAFRDVARDGKVQTIPFLKTAVELPESIDDFTRIQKPVSAMSYRELSEYVTQLEAAGYQARKYLVELYSKLSFPLVNLIMVLVAVPFAVSSPRSGRLFGVGLAIVIMAAYMVVHYTAVSFARADLLPPAIAAWTANVIFAAIGVSLFARLKT